MLKTVSRSAAVVLTVAALAGCVGQTMSVTSPSSSNAEVVRIEYWHTNNESFGGPAVKELVSKFNDAHPNIMVVDKFQAGSYAGLVQNLQAAIAAKKPPAVTQIGYNMTNYVAENVPHATAADLTKDQPGFFTTYYPNVLKLGQYKSKQIGFPYALSNPVVYYNKDVFKQAGLDPEKPPKTWDEVLQYSHQIKNKTGNYGFYMVAQTDNWMTQALIEGNGGSMLSEDGRVNYNSPEAVSAMQFWADLINAEKVTPYMTDVEAFQTFLSGKIGMYVRTIGARANVQKGATFSVGSFPFPLFEGKERKVPGGGNNLFVFATDKKEQAAALEFVKYLTSPEGLTIWTKGTGYLPVRQGVAEDQNYLKGFLTENPLMKAAVDQLPSVVPWVSIPGKNGLQAEKLLVDYRQDILSGKRDAKSTLDEAAAKANDLIRQK